MSHEHWPHANFTRFQKNNLGYFWPRLPTVKVFFFLVIFGQGYQWWKFWLALVIFGQGYQWWNICLVLVIFGQGYQRWKFLFFMDILGQGCFYWPLRLCDLRFWATSGIPLCQTRVRVRWRQLLAWDCKYEYTRTPVGKRWHESMSISYPGMERVKAVGIFPNVSKCTQI